MDNPLLSTSANAEVGNKYPFNQGEQAFLDGQGLDQNPYDETDIDNHLTWFAGWHEARIWKK